MLDVIYVVMLRVPPNELSHAAPMTQDNPWLHGKPGALPGVGSSHLVRRKAQPFHWVACAHNIKSA